MESNKIKTLNFWYKIFFGMGMFGLLDIIVGVFMKQAGYNFEIETGGLTFIIIQIILFIFGTKIAVGIFPFITIVSSVWFIWFIIAEWVIKSKIKKLEKDAGVVIVKGIKEPMSKGFKRMLFILLVPFGILLISGIILNLMEN